MMREFWLTTSWDDGAREDLKLAKLLKKYQIPATFYIPIKNPERRVLRDKEINSLSKEFEIGGHTLSHRDLTGLPKKEAKKEIEEGKKRLEEIIGKSVVSFSYPKGRVNSEIKQLVGTTGFRLARTTSLFGTKVGDKLLAPTTIHAYDHNPLLYIFQGVKKKLFYSLIKNRKFQLNWDKLAVVSLDWCLKNGGIFHLWGHSWEIEERGDWSRLEKVLAYIAKTTDQDRRLTNRGLLEMFKRRKKRFYKHLDPGWYEKTFDTRYYQDENKFLKKLVENFDQKGKKILDVGCGIGRVSILFKKADYTGVDFGSGLINFAKKKFQNKRFIVATYKNLKKLRLGKQDLVLIWGMFSDETDPFGALGIVEPLIRKNGRIILSLYNLSNPFFRIGQPIKSEFLKMPFPYATFTPRFISEQAKIFAKSRGFSFKILSFGVIPPIGGITKFTPGLNWRSLGVALVLVFDEEGWKRQF